MLSKVLISYKLSFLLQMVVDFFCCAKNYITIL
jgi:hypothetical protein